jgi:threonine/homoserine/homoserine lactone efflux protein
VLHLLLVLLPLGLAAAVSPVMLTEQTVLLATPDGRRTGLLYATGTVVVLTLLVGGVVLLGQSLSLPAAPHLDAALDLLLGALLCAIALMLHLWRRSDPSTSRQHTRKRMSPPAAFGFGVFSMATNVTTLALVAPAAKEIAASDVAAWEGVVAAALLVSLGCVPAWAPVVLVAVAPQTAGGLLDRLELLIQRHGRLLVVVLIAAAGVFLLVRGAARLTGL